MSKRKITQKEYFYPSEGVRQNVTPVALTARSMNVKCFHIRKLLYYHYRKYDATSAVILI